MRTHKDSRLPLTQAFVGIFAVVAAQGVMGTMKIGKLRFLRSAFPCAFAFLKLSHDPCAAITVENGKKRLGTRTKSGGN